MKFKLCNNRCLTWNYKSKIYMNNKIVLKKKFSLNYLKETDFGTMTSYSLLAAKPLMETRHLFSLHQSLCLSPQFCCQM